LVKSEVPQGSHLGLLIFIIFIEVLPDVEYLIYADGDDLKFFKVIPTLSDCHILHPALNSFLGWCFSNKLALMLKKNVM
jgi:hypothetical protein